MYEVLTKDNEVTFFKVVVVEVGQIGSTSTKPPPKIGKKW
jgi:hypothetical protein